MALTPYASAAVWERDFLHVLLNKVCCHAYVAESQQHIACWLSAIVEPTYTHVCAASFCCILMSLLL